jgi:oligoribonuclease NrnB/cAMP/cGMP phosphodiesterase (DHH superfamily)
MIDTSIAEDNWLTFLNNGDIYTGNNKKYSMIYRWGMDVCHISTIENISNEFVFKKMDEKNTECGIIYLNPNFKNDYWNQLPK